MLKSVGAKADFWHFKPSVQRAALMDSQGMTSYCDKTNNTIDFITAFILFYFACVNPFTCQ